MLKNRRIRVLNACDQVEDVRRAIKLGAHDYLS